MKKGTALKDIFNDFLKNELKDIAKQKKIRGYSTLNKEQLIDKIVEYMLNDEEVQKLKKEIQLDSLGCKLNLLVYLAELSVQGYAISSVTEFNSNGTKPRVAYANDKDFKKIVKYYSTKEA